LIGCLGGIETGARPEKAWRGFGSEPTTCKTEPPPPRVDAVTEADLFFQQRMRCYERESRSPRQRACDKKQCREATLDKTGGLIFAHPIQQAAGLVAPQL
jgi:hypothetical protein